MPTINPEDLGLPKGLKGIPQAVEIKEEFEERYKKLFGDSYKRFLQHSLSYARKSIRVNTLKRSVEEVEERLSTLWRLTPIPWCPEGFFIEHALEERFDIGNLIEHQLGYFYVQDAASMIPPIVLGPKPGEVVLDLCAAPGSKTTQLAAMMQNRGVLIANDVAGERAKPLGLNLQRCGVLNTLVTLRMNRKLPPVFDRVLVDAPCSATGTIRRSLKTLQMWSPSAVGRMASEQREILEQGWRALKPGGALVYSTCTLEPEEDEGMVSRFLEEHPEAELLPIDLSLQRTSSVVEWEGNRYNPEVEKCLRISPQDNDTEGFFVASFRRR